MATGALEHGVVARVRMASCANAIRVAVVRREVRVIKRGPGPAGRGVASIASRRKASGCVVWIGGPLIVRIVAAVTVGRQRRVVVVHVALRAGHIGGVITRERERCGVVIKGRILPIGEVVAGIARRRKADGSVRRCVGALVVALVALDAGGAGETVGAAWAEGRVMALATLQAGVRAAQRETGRRVIKRRARPTGGRVALIARGREARLHVVRVGRPVEVGLMALRAGAAGQAVVVVHVALSALQRCVRTRQGKTSRSVIKGRRRPVGRAMARLAGLGESSRRVWRIIRAIEIGQVATDASCVGAGQVVVAIHVALRALQRRMCAGQRESRGRVIERRVSPRRGGVALLASRREA